MLNHFTEAGNGLDKTIDLWQQMNTMILRKGEAGVSAGPVYTPAHTYRLIYYTEVYT